MRRRWRVGATLVVTGLCTAYILWKIDLRKTGHVLAHARVSWFLAALAIMALSVWPMAWRWQRLLAARGVHDSMRRLVRTYFVGYAAGQVLPTALGGDASRIYETARRHQGSGGAAAGTV
ncbi:MAG: lysylphosphatidylglycerol synthase transmembrane domain-containing protein, partial [Gaiellaceae bacterium]